MRRKEREIAERKDVEQVLSRAQVCYLGLSDGKNPYVVPVNFGYEDRALYFHSAPMGKKVELLRKNDAVSFACHMDATLVRGSTACAWSMKYRSVIGFGRARILEDPKEKEAGLEVLMRHYGKGPFLFDPAVLEKTLVIRVDVERLTGKQSL
jgi:nitroimidazol reductase NimA-like FMN-containing flavoprotein (pyridoxamine 5'-phosphate oxidase superfamily)